MSSLAFAKGVAYRDSTIGAVMMLQDEKGNWNEKHERVTTVKDETGEHVKREMLEPRIAMKAEKGRVVVSSKEGESSRIMQFSTKKTIIDNNESWSEKFEICHMKNGKAGIDVEVTVADEGRWMREFRERVKQGGDAIKYKDVTMERMKNAKGVWIFEEVGKKNITIEISEAEKEIAVVETTTTKSGERVDTKIFNLNNELLSFDSATNYGATPKIVVKRELEQMTDFLKDSSVKLREQAEKQEFNRYAAS